MAASSHSLTLSNFLTSLLPSVSPPSPSPATLVSLPRSAPLPSAAISLRREPPPGVADVAFPSATRSTALWFKSAYNVQVIAEDNEPEERLLLRFRREVFRAGVLQECRRRRFFENDHDRRKRKTKEAARRNRKRPLRPKVPTTKTTPIPEKKDDEEDDNWDGLNVELPY